MSFAAVPTRVSVTVREVSRSTGTLARGEAEALLGEYRSGIYSFLRRKGFNAEEADDLTQETLLRAYTHMEDFRSTHLAAWLYRIAANLCIDHSRKQRIATVPLGELGDVGACGEGAAGAGHDDAGARTELVGGQRVGERLLHRRRERVQLLLAAQRQHADRAVAGDVDERNAENVQLRRGRVVGFRRLAQYARRFRA